MHILIMNWDDLRYFLALSREGSVSGAGRALGVKHTTVARRIQALEQHMRTRLFDRSRSGYSMTQAAENLFNDVLELEQKIQQVDHKTSDQDAALAGILKLTVAHDLADRLIIPEIGKFLKTYPKIELQLLMTTGLIDLAAREADIAIRLTACPPEYLVGRELMKLRHGIYGTEEVLNNLSEPVNVILFRGEIDHPTWVTDHFENANAILRVDDVSSMATATRNGLGISKMPCFIGDTEPSLRRLDLKIQLSTWGVWLLNHIDLRATARVRACKDFLQDTLERKQHLIQGDNSLYI
ncbi:MAG: DNA-binding transcriptional LysR family regulator [Parasphingorhabdus sp.]|jgi:DNA-binding transcriptional LysR family regulator